MEGLLSPGPTPSSFLSVCPSSNCLGSAVVFIKTVTYLMDESTTMVLVEQLLALLGLLIMNFLVFWPVNTDIFCCKLTYFFQVNQPVFML